MKKVSVIVPFYNEEAALPALFDRLSALMDSLPSYEWEILMVNDGSTDHSDILAAQMRTKDCRFQHIELSRNFGKEAAMLAGFDCATGDCAVIMDADLQHPPEVVPAMLAKWEEGFDDVYGERVSRGNESWLRRKASILYYKLLRKSTRGDVLPNVGDFRLLDRSCVDALKQLRETHRYTKGLFCFIGFKKANVPFEQASREKGSTKWSLAKLLSLAIEGLTSHTTLPLRIATFLGSVVSAGAIIYLIYIVLKTLIVGEPVAGYPTLMVTILFLGGVILLTIGIIGEYIARIFDETKNRPSYFIRRINGTTPGQNG